jgi:hypothetical protein
MAGFVRSDEGVCVIAAQAGFGGAGPRLGEG